ncbi:MAG: hypothetical protein ACKVTZ_02015 [Bacteroidia bacterium]
MLNLLNYFPLKKRYFIFCLCLYTHYVQAHCGDSTYYEYHDALRYTRYEYNLMGKLETYTTYFSVLLNGKILGHHYQAFSPDDELIGEGKYEYDKEGKLLKEADYQYKRYDIIIDNPQTGKAHFGYVPDSFVSEIKYSYQTENKQKVKIEYRKWGDSPLAINKFYYDDKERVVKMIVTDSQAVVYQKYDCFYHEKDTLCYREQHTSDVNNDTLWVTLYQFDEKGRHKSAKTYSNVPPNGDISKGEWTEQTFYTYSAAGKLTNSTSFMKQFSDKEPATPSFESNYTYDELGRIVTSCESNTTPLMEMSIEEVKD